jgi:hypothetical protein
MQKVFNFRSKTGFSFLTIVRNIGSNILTVFISNFNLPVEQQSRPEHALINIPSQLHNGLTFSPTEVKPDYLFDEK